MGFRETTGIVQTGKHIGMAKLRVAGQDVFNRIAGAEKTQNGVHRDASTANDRTAVADLRINFDTFHGGDLS